MNNNEVLNLLVEELARLVKDNSEIIRTIHRYNYNHNHNDIEATLMCVNRKLSNIILEVTNGN